jgi:hypothetical protein
MSAAAALKAVRAAGIEIVLDGDDLALSAASAPPAAMLDELAQHKAGIVALLRTGHDGWSGEDWLALFDERAGIAEFDGGLPRAEAEARAFECCVAVWLNRNPVCSSPGHCLECGGRAEVGHAATIWHRADRPCLAASALLGDMACKAESQGGCHFITDPEGPLMGKRSSFERRKADFYPTPRAAVVHLIPYLRGIRSFAEPCAGDGDLVRHLESFGLRRVYAGDIRTGHDALTVDSCGVVDAIITNPPFSRESRPLMHRMILHFQRIAPTWLLLPHDWSTNKGSAPYLRCCSDIVAIGRVKWIEGSKYTGKDNYGWFRFEARHANGPVFHGRDQNEIIPARRRTCERCGRSYEPERASSRFCSPACRQATYRKRLAVTASVTAKRASDSSTEEVFRYVRHADVPRFMAEGWELLHALDGTHHGEYSALMRRRIQ